MRDLRSRVRLARGAEVRALRPTRREAYLVLRSIPGERGEVDWADFGKVSIGRAERRLSAFVMTLAHSRAIYVEFFLDQQLENFLRGHVHAFLHFGGVPRTIATDNLRSVVLERRGDAMCCQKARICERQAVACCKDRVLHEGPFTRRGRRGSQFRRDSDRGRHCA